MRKKIPTGSVFQKTYPDRQGRKRKTATFYLKFYVHGKFLEVPSGTTDYDQALAMLRQKMAGAARRGTHSDQPERVHMNQLFDLLLDDYRHKNRRSTYDAGNSAEQLENLVLGGKRRGLTKSRSSQGGVVHSL